MKDRVLFLEDPFAIPRRPNASLPRLEDWVARAVERVLGLSELSRLYAGWRSSMSSGPDRSSFAEAALRLLDISPDVSADDCARVPADGGLIVVANHPRGALDGLALAALLRRRRADARLLGNYLLARIPEMHDACIFVDPFGATSAARQNAAGLREALQFVEGGGALVVFPAGEVAHQRTWKGPVEESPWHIGVARLAERTGAPVVPVHIAGANGRLFQWSGLVHPTLRTALLARELVRARHTRVMLRIGNVVTWEQLARLRSATARAEYLRLRTLALSMPSAEPPSRCQRASGGSKGKRSPNGNGQRALAQPVASERLASDVDALDPACALVEHGPFQVLCADASQLPHVLREIARLREVAFRAVGEGTGRARDLDRFDACYQHLFVWHRDDRAIVGAYRVGATDRVARLYTRTLFDYDRQLLSAFGPAIELGRSFVAPAYQRDYLPLLLLWKGIGHLVARWPRYRILYGPVSVSGGYSEAGRELIARTLSQHRFRSPWAHLVSTPRPLGGSSAVRGRARQGRAPIVDETSTLNSRLPTTPDELNRWLTEIEPDGKGLPVLLRQYLKLNGRLLGFSVDPNFGHTLDGLMVVDLADVDGGTLQRYMGREGAEAWLAHQRGARTKGAPITPVEASA